MISKSTCFFSCVRENDAPAGVHVQLWKLNDDSPVQCIRMSKGRERLHCFWHHHNSFRSMFFGRRPPSTNPPRLGFLAFVRCSCAPCHAGDRRPSKTAEASTSSVAHRGTVGKVSFCFSVFPLSRSIIDDDECGAISPPGGAVSWHACIDETFRPLPPVAHPPLSPPCFTSLLSSFRVHLAFMLPSHPHASVVSLKEQFHQQPGARRSSTLSEGSFSTTFLSL